MFEVKRRPSLPYTIPFMLCTWVKINGQKGLTAIFIFIGLVGKWSKYKYSFRETVSQILWGIDGEKNITVLLFSFFDKCNGRGTYHRHVDWFKFCKWFPILLDWRAPKEIHQFHGKSTLHNFCYDIQYTSYVLHH